MYKTTSLLPLVADKLPISTFILLLLVNHLNIHFLLVFKIKLNPNNCFVGELVILFYYVRFFPEDDIEKDPYFIPYHWPSSRQTRVSTIVSGVSPVRVEFRLE